MKRMGRIAIGLALILGMVGCFGAAKKYEKAPSLATWDGKIAVKGLKGEVEVWRDGYGVPHIFTEDPHDLFFAVGYLQAQDRLWEMVFLRAVSEGRLAELFGDFSVPGQEMMGWPLSTTGVDRFQRTMGIKWLGEVGEALLKEVDPAAFAQMQSYCDGVNAFLDSHREWEQLPVEFQVLRMKPLRWRVADVVSFSVFIGSMLCGNMDTELGRYGLIKKYGPDLGWQFMPLHDSLGPTIVPPDLLKNKLATPRDLPPGGRPSDAELGNLPPLSGDAAFKLMQTSLAIKRAFYIDNPLASNNWVVGPKITKTGTAMLANDPHLEHLEPSLFYLMHIKGAGFDAYGAAFAGTPYPVLAHTRKLAWGATTSQADVQDLFIETTDKAHPGKYLYKGEWKPFVIRKEVIRVRVGSNLVAKEFAIKQTVHGPVINGITNLPEDTPPLAMRWTGWDFDRNLEVFNALVQSPTVEEFMTRFNKIPREGVKVRNIALMYNILLKGESVDDFVRALDMLIIPNQNWVAADSQGHIAYLPGGLVPIRKKGIGVTPVPGASGDYDWSGFIPLMELPYAIDPPRGYMATANNEVVDAELYPYLFATGYGDGWRAARIEELIRKLAPLDLNAMKKIQNDVYVKRAEWEVPIVLKAVDRKKPTDPEALRAADELRKWDCEAELDRTGVIVFYQFNKELRKNTLMDELPTKDYQAYLAGGKSDLLIQNWMNKGGSPFFDDKRTKDATEDMDDVIVKSLGDAMRWVEKQYGKDAADWQWGKVHWIKWYNPLGFGPLSSASVGPFPHIGADQTVRNASTAGFGKYPYKCLGGPVLRHLMDLGDPDHALMVIDGSQSGQWLSPHYSDMHRLWLNGEYVTAVMTPALVTESAKYHLVLAPAGK